MSDPTTIDVYDSSVERYAAITSADSASASREAFLAQAQAGGELLDWGCGPAHDAALMARRGFVVDAVDASAAMIRHALMAHGVAARQATFDELDATDRYAGIWANFSLLHAERDDFRRHLQSAWRALRADGVLYVALKLGEGSGRDSLGRRYTYYSEEELSGLLSQAGFESIERFSGRSAGLSGEQADWIGLLVRKALAQPE